MSTLGTSMQSSIITAILVCCAFVKSRAEEALRPWSAAGISGPERAALVNRQFTNGTPMSSVVLALGTNYTRVSNISIQGLQPRNTSGLIYRFAEQEIVVASSAATNAEPISGTFIAAAYLRARADRVPRNYIYIGQQDGAANRGQPVSSETNRTPAAAGSGR